MTIGTKVLILLLVMGCAFVILLMMKFKIQRDKLKVYEDITLAVLNSDKKTRRTIEKLCNDYLEHKVINKSIVNARYLSQCNLILDTVKYINVITAIEPMDEKEKQLSKIEEAIETNNNENVATKKVDTNNSVKRRGRPRKEV